MPKYQATAYIRLSYTDDRSSESDSVTNQRKLIENFIERNPDIQIVSEKIDDGYSGIIFDRPAFKEMMQDITDGKINCVIVKDLSCLGRTNFLLNCVQSCRSLSNRRFRTCCKPRV